MTEKPAAASEAGPRRSKRTHPPSAKAVEIAAGGSAAEPPATKKAKTATESPRKKSPKAKGKAKAEMEARAAAIDKFTELPSVFVRLLVDTKVQDFQWELNKNKPIFVCNREDRVMDVFRGLIRHNLQSVPVMTKDDQKYHSFIDLHDICHWVVEHFGDKLSGDASHDFWKLVDQESAFAEKRVRELEERPYSSKTKFHPVESGFSMFSVFEAMAKIKNLRRVAIITPSYQLLNLHTQSQMIDYLVENLDLIGKKAHKQLSDCSGFFKKVISVTERDTAYTAFKLMADNKITGVAVVDPKDGRMKGNLSVRDLKLLSGDLRLFWRLQQSVKNFVTKLREEFQSRHKRPQRLVYARYNETIETVLRQLKEHKVHRVYICDTRRIPIGLVSLRDMLGQILTESPNAVREMVNAYRAEVSGAERSMSPIERITGVDFEAADKEPMPPLNVPAIPAAPLPPLQTTLTVPAKGPEAAPINVPITFVPSERDIPIVGAGPAMPHALPAPAPGLPGVALVPGVASATAATVVPGVPGVAGVALPAVAAVQQQTGAVVATYPAP